jgi:hypothetical protein
MINKMYEQEAAIRALAKAARQQDDLGVVPEDAESIMLSSASSPNVENKDYLPYLQKRLGESKRNGTYRRVLAELWDDFLMAD